jgi:hypothetical protein
LKNVHCCAAGGVFAAGMDAGDGLALFDACPEREHVREADSVVDAVTFNLPPTAEADHSKAERFAIIGSDIACFGGCDFTDDIGFGQVARPVVGKPAGPALGRTHACEGFGGAA